MCEFSADAYYEERGLPGWMNRQTILIQLKSRQLKAQGTPGGSALSRSGPTTELDDLVSD